MDEQNGTGHIKMAEQKLSCIIHTGISIPNSFIAFIPADFVGRGKSIPLSRVIAYTGGSYMFLFLVMVSSSIPNYR